MGSIKILMSAVVLNNQTLKSFIESVKIKQDQKDFLISKLPQMNLEERAGLLKTLTNIYLLDSEEKAVAERIRERLMDIWQE